VENKLKANGESKSIRELLDTQKYKIDYYQREYKWTTVNVIELLSDLENKFLLNYSDEHERFDVQSYSHYFLGSIIVNAKKNEKFIVDGQQRLTTITLLLLYLNKIQHELLHEKDEEVLIENLIYSKKFGKKSFNLDIIEREEIMEAIFSDKQVDLKENSESIKNIRYRYEDIVANFPESLKYSKQKLILPFFLDWFIENVDLVEITTYSEDDAYTIFETMNDRGLSLSPADMLKGYVLTNIKDDDKRDKANELWRNQITKLIKYNKKEESDFFKAWLRAKYAETIREGKKGASNKDFEIIGVQFHRWVRDNKDKLNLANTETFYDFIQEFVFYSKIYLDLKYKSDNLIEGFEQVFYNNYNNFTLQYPLILSAIKLDDSEEDIEKKIKLVSRFIDTFIVLRSINRRTLGYSAIYYTIFNLIKRIRDSDVETLSKTIKNELINMDVDFSGSTNLILHNQNKRFIHFLLARITNYIELKSKRVSYFESYISRKIKDPFEVEHIIPNKFMDYIDEFDDQLDFEETRNKLGDLLLLPSSFNKSYNDKPYEDKVEQYYSQNLLAQSLNRRCYVNNPSFLKFKAESGLVFEPYNMFLRKQIIERQKLYSDIIEEIWDFKQFDELI
jgi:uncharacterized protein with ParB-like and HNH nuclease domain